MRFRWLVLRTEMLLEMLQPGVEYRVLRDPVPEGARVVRSHACGSGEIALLIESAQFDETTEGEVPTLAPVVQCTEIRDPRFNN